MWQVNFREYTALNIEVQGRMGKKLKNQTFEIIGFFESRLLVSVGV